MNEQTNEQQLTTSDEISTVPSPTGDELSALRSENAELKNQLRLRSARDEFTKLLMTENARSPELLFDAVHLQFDYHDDGRLKNSNELLGDLKDRFPEQFIDKPEPPQLTPMIPNINGGAGRASSKPQLTKQMLASMKPRDIASLDWHEVKQVLEK